MNNCKDDGYFEANGKKWSCAFYPTPINKQECEAQKSELGIKWCKYDKDYWAGAVKQCGGVQNLPTMADLAKIVSLIYVGNPNVGAYNNISNLTYKAGTATSLGLSEPAFFLWSEECSQESALNRRFGTSSTMYYDGSYYGDRKYSGNYIQAICRVD